MSAWSYAFGFAVYVAGTIGCYQWFGFEPRHFDYLPYFLLPIFFWTDEVYWRGQGPVTYAAETVPWAWLRWDARQDSSRVVRLKPAAQSKPVKGKAKLASKSKSTSKPKPKSKSTSKPKPRVIAKKKKAA